MKKVNSIQIEKLIASEAISKSELKKQIYNGIIKRIPIMMAATAVIARECLNG